MTEMYTLAELLQTAELRLRLRAGSQESLSRAVAGAHSIEVENPTRWLGREWVMLTTGLRLRDDENAQRALIRELDAAGASGLGFAEGVVLAEVPTALLEEADRCCFPVFTVPIETPLRDVTAVVHSSLLSRELRDARRLASVQHYLVEALKEPDMRGAVLHRFAAIMDVGVTALDASDASEFGSGPGEQELRAALAGCPAIPHDLCIGDWKAHAAPIPTTSGWTGWLVAARRHERPDDAVVKSATQSVVSLLEAADGLDRAARQQDRVLRAALLKALIRAGGNPQTLNARAAVFGLDLSKPSDVVVVASRRSSESFDRLREKFEAALPPCAAVLSAVHDGVLVLLIQTSPAALTDILNEMLSSAPDAIVGIGRTVESVQDIERSYRDARCATEILRRSPSESRRLLHFEQMDIGAVIISEAGASRVQSRARPILSFLRNHELLAEAVETYFEEKMDVIRASERLFLHPNSLRYRLRRVEEVLGLSLKDPADITNLYIAMLSERETPDAVTAT